MQSVDDTKEVESTKKNVSALGLWNYEISTHLAQPSENSFYRKSHRRDPEGIF